MLRHALERMPGNVDALVGLAGVHLQIGALEEAAQWCDRALAAAQPSSAAERVREAIVDAYVSRGTRRAIEGRLDQAIETLARGAALMDARPIALYRDLFILMRSWLAEAGRVAAAADAIRFSIPVWGEDYIESTCAGLLRSLLAPGNIPALARTNTIILEFTTRERDRHALEAAPVIAALRAHATIAYVIIPDHLAAKDTPRDFSYWLMSAGHYGSAERARRSGSALSLLTADMMLSDGSLFAAHRHVADGAQAVLIRALEVDRDRLPGGNEVGMALSVAPDDLVRLALDQAKAAMPDGWGGVGDAPFDIASNACFPIDGGVALHGFHFLPLLVSARLAARPFAYDMLTVDTRFVRLALGEEAPAGRIKVIDDAREIAIVSTIRAGRSAPGARLLKCERLGRWAASWCFTPADAAYFDWCFRRRTVYRPGRTDAAPPPAAQERDAVAAVLQAYIAAATAHLMRRTAEAAALPGRAS
jgi:hypothetical protein